MPQYTVTLLELWLASCTIRVDRALLALVSGEGLLSSAWLELPALSVADSGGFCYTANSNLPLLNRSVKTKREMILIGQ